MTQLEVDAGSSPHSKKKGKWPMTGSILESKEKSAEGNSALNIFKASQDPLSVVGRLGTLHS